MSDDFRPNDVIPSFWGHLDTFEGDAQVHFQVLRMFDGKGTRPEISTSEFFRKPLTPRLGHHLRSYVSENAESVALVDTYGGVSIYRGDGTLVRAVTDYKSHNTLPWIYQTESPFSRRPMGNRLRSSSIPRDG